MYSIELDFGTDDERAAAAVFIAGLVKQGLVFKAREVRGLLIVELTGGY